MANGNNEEIMTKLGEIITLLNKVSGDISELPKKGDPIAQNAEETVNFEWLVENTKSLAIISERRDRVKEKLEAGDLKANDLARLGIEYDKLGKACDELIKRL